MPTPLEGLKEINAQSRAISWTITDSWEYLIKHQIFHKYNLFNTKMMIVGTLQ
jgi:hypothetical protein